MSRALQIAHLAVLCAATVLLAVLSLLAWRAQQSLKVVAVDLHYTTENANRLIRESAQTVSNLRHATAVWEKSSADQSAAATQSARKTAADLDALGIAIAHLDSAIVAHDAALAALEAQGAGAMAELRFSLSQTAPALQAATETLQHTAQATGDPAILETLHHVDQTAANVASATASLDRSTQMVEARVRQMTKPGSWAGRVGMAILDVGSKLGSILAGFLKI